MKLRNFYSSKRWKLFSPSYIASYNFLFQHAWRWSAFTLHGLLINFIAKLIAIFLYFFFVVIYLNFSTKIICWGILKQFEISISSKSSRWFGFLVFDFNHFQGFCSLENMRKGYRIPRKGILQAVIIYMDSVIPNNRSQSLRRIFWEKQFVYRATWNLSK